MAVRNPTLIQMGALGRPTPMSVGDVEYLHGFADRELGVVEWAGPVSHMEGRKAAVGETGWYPGKYVGEAVGGAATGAAQNLGSKLLVGVAIVGGILLAGAIAFTAGKAYVDESVRKRVRA